MLTVSNFDVLLSFARTERVYARAIYSICQANGITTFLDEEFQHEVWGKNLVEYLDELYRDRGTYCVALLSEDYRNRAYTKVERRAAFDRMIQQSGEYFLPVKIDDSWIDGLPKSTAYLDIRIQGIIGVCEILVKKIHGNNEELVIPENINIPRVPLGQLKAEHLSKYLLELCQRQPVTLFGAVVYDEKSAEIRKVFSDQIYWDALDEISGPDFEIFALRDKEDFEVEFASRGKGSFGTRDTIEMLTVTSSSRSRSRHHYFSHLLKDYFGKEKTRMVYPSLLLFIISEETVKYSLLIPLRSETVEKSFQTFKSLFALIANTIMEWKTTSGLREIDNLWLQLRKTIDEAGYIIYIQDVPLRIKDAIEKLQPFMDAG